MLHVLGTHFNLMSGLRSATNAYTSWMDGESVRYVDWAANEPSSLEEECVAYVRDKNDGSWKWKDVQCTAAEAAICKQPPTCSHREYTPL